MTSVRVVCDNSAVHAQDTHTGQETTARGADHRGRSSSPVVWHVAPEVLGWYARMADAASEHSGANNALKALRVLLAGK